MPSVRPKTCRECGRTVQDEVHVSWRGLCEECGDARALLTGERRRVLAERTDAPLTP